MPKRFHVGWVAICMLLLVSCLGPLQPDATPTAIPSTFTPTLSPTLTPTFTITPTDTPSPTPTISATPEPYGCQKPPDDYRHIDINGWTINARTLAMLDHAMELYGGEIQVNGRAITQGSYHDNGAASFGTHLGGGAVDLSVLRWGTYTILWDDIEPLLHALRVAGFAAWFREYGELYTNSPVHIHAIAIGDQELSQAAQDQLTGEAGYFRGYTGLPVATYGAPKPDRNGGPILCQWMIDTGYQDLR